MINLALLKNNKWFIGALVIIVLIILVSLVKGLNSLFHPNNDSDIIKASKARKVITDQVISTNKELKKAIDDKEKSNKIDNDIIIEYTKEESKVSKKVQELKTDLNTKQILNAIKASKIQNIDASTTKAVKELENDMAKDNINTIYAVFNTVKDKGK